MVSGSLSDSRWKCVETRGLAVERSQLRKMLVGEHLDGQIIRRARKLSVLHPSVLEPPIDCLGPCLVEHLLGDVDTVDHAYTTRRQPQADSACSAREIHRRWR